jgi:hypothetical protein
MAALAAVAGATKVAGSLMGAKVAEQEGRAARYGKESEAAQYDQQAGQEIAVAQRGAMEQRRRAKLVASRALAVSAASGGGASDPTVARIIADIEGEGAYRAATELYRGEESARKLRMAASGSRYEGALAERSGKIKSRAYKLQAFGDAAQMGGGMYQKYGGSGPSTQIGSNDSEWA